MWELYRKSQWPVHFLSAWSLPDRGDQFLHSHLWGWLLPGSWLDFSNPFFCFVLLLFKIFCRNILECTFRDAWLILALINTVFSCCSCSCEVRIRLICASDVYSMCTVCFSPSDTNMCRKCTENCLKCTSYSICTECKVDTRWNKFSEVSWINSSANIALSSSAAENTDAHTLSAVLLQLVRATFFYVY